MMQLEQTSKSPNPGDGLIVFLRLTFYAFLGSTILWCAALLLVLKSIVSTIKDLLTMEPFSRQTGIHTNPTIKAIETAQETNH